ncbi:MAG: caspase family protein [Pyrinomonadaceae bacterium]
MTSFLKLGLHIFLISLFATISTPAQKPELMVQKGTGAVSSIAFSPDGKTLAGASNDDLIKLWDVATGRELRSFAGNAPIAFRNDGRTLAWISDNTAIKLWDIVSGNELRILSGHTKSVRTFVFSKDGTTLASGSEDDTIKLWEVETGRELQTFSGHPAVQSIAISPDGKTFVTGGSESYDSPIKLWDSKTGAPLRTFYGHSLLITSVAISPDGKILASGSGSSDDSTIKLWDITSGKELRTLSGHHKAVTALTFSPDGARLASAGLEKEIKLWDVATGQEAQILSGHSYAGWSVAFSPDGKTLASGGQDETVMLWKVGSGGEGQSLSRNASSITSLAFSPDGHSLAGGYADGVRLWGLTGGQDLRNLSIPMGGDEIRWWGLGGGQDVRTISNRFGVHDVVFSRDGKVLAIGDVLWDLSSGKKVQALTEGTSSPTVTAISPDGAIAATTYDGLKLWNVKTGRQLQPPSVTGQVVSVAFGPDGKTLAVRVNTGESIAIKFWDLAAGVELRSWAGDKEGAGLAFSPDSKTLATIGRDHTIKLRDVSTGVTSGVLKGSSGSSLPLIFSWDGKMLASGSDDGLVRVWDVAARKEVRTFGKGSTIAFSPNGRILATAEYSDRAIELWDLKTAEPLASLFSFDKEDWVAVTPDGQFDGSPGAWGQILWRFSPDLYDVAPVEAFFSDFYYPGLLTDIFAGKRPKAPSDIAQKDRRQPQLKLTVADAKADTTVTAQTVKVKINVSQAPAGAQDVRLFRNGSLVKEWHGDVLKGESSVTLEAAIPMISGENQLSAYAFNHDNIKSTDATLVVTGSDSLKRKGVAYLLALGVNEYSNNRYNLKYAVADAQDFAVEVKRQQQALGNYASVEVIPLYDQNATKVNILRALSDLAAKVQPEDGVIIYFAGHGVASGNRFYLVAHDLGYDGSRTDLDEAGLQKILAHGISDEELQKAVEGIDAGQLLLVIDACNSGQALEAEEKRHGPMNSKGLAQLAYEKGMYILTAAQSYQAALEASKLGHGYLTYALVEEGLKSPAADTEPKDGSVLLREWLDYATNRVPAMQQETLDAGGKTVETAKTPQAKRQLVQQVISFTNGEQTTDPAARTVQRPRVFYRREIEPNPLVIARP